MSTWSLRGITQALLPLLLILTLLEIGSGLILGEFEAVLFQYPALLILVPVMIGTGGNLGSILAARISTAVHLGTLSFDVSNEPLVANGLLTIGLAVSIFPIVGISGWFLAGIVSQTTLGVNIVVTIAFISGLVLALIAIVVTFLATYAAYQLQLDPDDVVIPVVTNVCDILGVIVLFVVAQLLVPK